MTIKNHQANEIGTCGIEKFRKHEPSHVIAVIFLHRQVIQIERGEMVAGDKKSPMTGTLPTLTLDELRSSPWMEAIHETSEHCFYSYWRDLSTLSEKFPEGSSQSKTLKVLAYICWLMLNEECTSFTPFPEHISPETLNPLFDFASDIDNPLLCSRIMDILWVRRIPQKTPEAAELAVESYLKSVSLINYKPFESLVFLRRAWDIAYRLGKTKKHLQTKVKEMFIEAAEHFRQDDLDGIHARFYKVMAERKIGEQTKLSEYMLQAAEFHESKSSFLLARMFFDLAIQFSTNAQQSDEQIKSISIQRAKTFETEATLEKNNIVRRAFALELAIQAYRSIDGQSDKIDALHKELLIVQKQIPETFTKHEIPIDLSEGIRKVQKRMSGKECYDALISLAFICPILNFANDRTESVKRIEKFLFYRFFPKHQINSKGKTISKTEAIGLDKVTGAESAIYSDMVNHSHNNFLLNVTGCIIPALNVFLDEHGINDTVLLDLIKNNPLVPSGREMFYFKGIKAGFEHDFLLSSHLLIPQFENSIRELMEQNGIITSNISLDGIQLENSLSILLGNEFVKSYFGENYVYTFKALLVEPVGANLRNRFAHGLAEYNELNGISAIYFWWLILRLLITPLAQEYFSSEPKSQSSMS